VPDKSSKSEKINLAVQLIVEGAGWTGVASKLGYSTNHHGDSAYRNLCANHRQEWNAAYEVAYERHMAVVESEAVLTQRDLLRCDDLSIRQRASHSLLNHVSKLRAQRFEISGRGGAPIKMQTTIEEQITFAADRIRATLGNRFGDLNPVGSSAARHN